MRFRNVVIIALLAAAVHPLGGQLQPTGGTLIGVVKTSDNLALPAVMVEIQNTLTGQTFMTITDDEGRYTQMNVPAAGSYRVRAFAEGFNPGERSGIEMSNGKTRRANFLLTLATLSQDDLVTAEAPSIDAAVNLGSNRPGYLLQSALNPGTAFNTYGRGMGEDDLNSVEDLPIGTDLNGFKTWVMMGKERFDGFPLFNFKNQAAAILPSNTPVGRGALHVELNGEQSPAFGIDVVEAQPSFFNLPQGSQIDGIFTDLDFMRKVHCSCSHPE